jgi:hypothetical protein
MPRLLEAFRLKQLRGMSALPRAWQSIVVWQTLLIGRMYLCGGHCHSIDCFVKSGLQSAGGGLVSNHALSSSLDCSMPMSRNSQDCHPRRSSSSWGCTEYIFLLYFQRLCSEFGSLKCVTPSKKGERGFISKSGGSHKLHFVIIHKRNSNCTALRT